MHTPTIPPSDRAAPRWPAALALVLTAPLCAQYTVARLGDRPAERQGHAAFYDEPRGRVAIHGGAGYPAGNNPGDTWQLDATRWARMAGGTLDRTYAAAAEDPSRQGNAVLFGGQDAAGVHSGETWVWDSAAAAWANRSPAVAPPARVLHAMAFDPVRSRVVLFGGGDQAGPLSDVWEWNGTTWTQHPPVFRPLSRRNHAMAWDGTRNRVVLFGGWNGGSFSDTWFFDGSSWSGGGPGFTSPPGRHNHMMAWDPVRQQTVLFGGKNDAGTLLSDTWVLGPSGWTQRTPSRAPFGRELATLTWDGRRQKLVLVGGYAQLGELSGLVSDAWEWDGATWAQIADTAPVYTVPSRTREHAAAFDYFRGRMVVFGGDDTGSSFSNETWHFAEDTWQRRITPFAPGQRRAAAMVYDFITGNTLVFGGSTRTGYVNDLHAFDGVDWTSVSGGGSTPDARSGHAMVVDGPRQRAVLFGGRTGLGVANDTWELTLGASPTWIPLSPATVPPARDDHAMAFDPIRNVTILHGGRTRRGAVFGDTWQWDGSSWTMLSGGGTDRSNHALAFDENRGRVVMFGGFAQTGVPSPDSLLEWDGSTWVTVPTTNPPPGQLDVTLVFDSFRRRLVLHGAYGTLLNYTTHDLGPDGRWRPIYGPQSSPPPRTHHATGYDPVRNLTVLVGGRNSDGSFAQDHYEYDGGAWRKRLPVIVPYARYAHAMAFDSSAGGGMTLFGGIYPDGRVVGDTWVYDATADLWRELNVQGPSARYNHAMVDSGSGVILFGGHDGATVLGDTYVCVNGGWFAQFTRGAPSARHAHAMAWDARRGRLVMFGGQSGRGGFLGDTWEFSFGRLGGTWSQMNPARSPSPRWDSAMTYDASRGRVVLAGGYDGGFPGDVWEWDGADWSRRTPETATALAAENLAATYDAARRRVVLFGGNAFGLPASDATLEITSRADLAGQGQLGTSAGRIRALAPAVTGRALPISFWNPRRLAILAIDPGPFVAPRFQVAPPTVCATSNVFSNLSFTAPVTTNSPYGFAPSVPNDPSLVGNRLAFSAFVVQPTGCLAVLDPLHVIVQAP